MKRKGKIVTSVLLLATICGGYYKVNAANSYIPELNVYQQGASPKIEIGVDIPDEDIIDVIGFENTSEYEFNQRKTGNGNQSISTTEKYNGSKSYKLTDTITNSTGNDLDPVEVGYRTTPSSRLTFNKTFYANNGQYMSLTCKVKAKGEKAYSTLVFEFANKTYKSIPYKDLSGHEVKFRDKQTFTKFPEYIYVYTDYGAPDIENNHHQAICSSKTDYKQGLYRYEAEYQRFKWASWDGGTVSSSNRDTFEAGDVVMTRNWPGAATIRNYVTDSQWHTVSFNAQFTNNIEYADFSKDGAYGYLSNATDSELYIDDVKYGYASRLQVMRDNSTTVYNDYGSEFTDSYHVTPNNPNVISAATNATDVTFSFKADTKSETHTYKARSLGSSGNKPSAWSKDYPITLTSTPVGYSVKVDKNASTDPGTVKNNATGVASVSGYRKGDVIYCHVRTVDQNGQWSAPIHYRYTVQQTALDLKDDINSFANKLSISNTTDINSVKSQISALRTNTNIPYNITKIDKSNATKYVKGKLEITATVNGQAKAFNTPIECKPIYQTEQELKEDITDYIGQTKIHVDKKQLIDKMAYEASKETETIEKDINDKCKTNPDLKDITIEFNNTATEFKSGKLEGKIYLKD